MFSAFRMSPAVSGRGLCAIDSLVSNTPEKYQKIEKSLKDRIQPIFSQMGKLELSDKFRGTRTSQFFLFFWGTPN